MKQDNEFNEKIDSIRSQLRELGRHPEILKLAREDLDKRIKEYAAQDAAKKDPRSLSEQIENVKSGLRELGRFPEVRDMAEKDMERLAAPLGVTVKGAECNGCSICLPCFVTPSPDMEIFLGTYSFNFKP